MAEKNGLVLPDEYSELSYQDRELTGSGGKQWSNGVTQAVLACLGIAAGQGIGFLMDRSINPSTLPQDNAMGGNKCLQMIPECDEELEADDESEQVSVDHDILSFNNDVPNVNQDIDDPDLRRYQEGKEAILKDVEEVEDFVRGTQHRAGEIQKMVDEINAGFNIGNEIDNDHQDVNDNSLQETVVNDPNASQIDFTELQNRADAIQQQVDEIRSSETRNEEAVQDQLEYLRTQAEFNVDKTNPDMMRSLQNDQWVNGATYDEISKIFPGYLGSNIGSHVNNVSDDNNQDRNILGNDEDGN